MKKIKWFICVVLVAMLTSILSGCAAVIPIPEIKEGRFDFSVTCEVNGEEKTFSGVYVCKYDGAYKTLAGEGIKWNGYVENGEENGVIPVQTNDDGVIYIDLHFVEEYFMDDPDAICYDVPAPSLYMLYHYDDPDEVSYETDEEIIATSYGVKLIRYKYADPIENTFKEKFTFVHFEPTIN